jgi:hypothetical protein
MDPRDNFGRVEGEKNPYPYRKSSSDRPVVITINITVVYILDRAHQLLVYVDDVNLLGDNLETINKNTETLIDVSVEVGLEVNTEKTKSPECRAKS